MADSGCDDIAYTPCIKCIGTAKSPLVCVCPDGSGETSVPDCLYTSPATPLPGLLHFDCSTYRTPPRLLSPEEEIEDLCGKFDQSLKLARDLILDSQTAPEHTHLSYTDTDNEGDHVLLHAPKKIETAKSGSFVVGAEKCPMYVGRSVVSTDSNAGLSPSLMFDYIVSNAALKDPYAIIGSKRVRQPSQMAWFGEKRYDYCGVVELASRAHRLQIYLS